MKFDFILACFHRSFTLDNFLGESFVAGMTQDEVDVFECLNSVLKIVLRMSDSGNFDCGVLDDEISTHIQGTSFSYFTEGHIKLVN